jgi:CheY-like chemotaxis protein
MNSQGFDEIPLASLCEAVSIYCKLAFPAGGEQIPPLKECADLSAALELFVRDQRAGNMRRWTLRLGNARYPFMKLVFQELLVKGRFFFAVDTHDDVELKDSFPDYDAWLELKRWNQQLKERIERSWREAGVPTFIDVVARVERETPPGPGVRHTAPRVLVVDDDLGIAQGVQAMLQRRGYRTTVVHTAEAALESIAKEAPDLVLSDLEMGVGKSGLELATELRAQDDTRRIPFILATAASIASSNFAVVDGFMVKPFETGVLLKFIARHIGTPEERDRRGGSGRLT